MRGHDTGWWTQTDSDTYTHLFYYVHKYLYTQLSVYKRH